MVFAQQFLQQELIRLVSQKDISSYRFGYLLAIGDVNGLFLGATIPKCLVFIPLQLRHQRALAVVLLDGQG
jgi:hypothetical protein